MKRHMKKLGALALALMLTLTAAIPVSAAGDKPSDTDKAIVTVENVEAGMTVTAYQIVDGKYNENGFTGYEAVDGVTIVDLKNPTQAELLKIVEDLDTLGLTQQVLPWDTATNKYKDELTVGSWLILVTGAAGAGNAKVYNPMIGSVYYTVDGGNTPEGGTVDANQAWSLQGDTVYAKSSEPTLKKELVNPGSGNAKGDDVAYGGTVTYKITVAIPSYNKKTFANPVFKVEDTLSSGLTLDTSSIKVNLAEAPAVDIAAGDATYSNTSTGNVITIEFKPAFILANGQKTVTITYSAELKDSAPYNFDENANSAKLTYSNSPTTTTEVEDKVYVYTFGLDANLSANITITGATETHEIVKVDADTYEEKATYEEWDTAGKKGALSGATFALTKAELKDGKVTPIAGATPISQTSDANGALSFTGLDAGYYTLVETAAPSEFSLDGTVHTVYINPEYNTDGTLKKYSVVIDGTATSVYTATYDTTTKTLTKIDKTEVPTFIKNTKLSALPSTGGMGTYLFTVIGAAVMATAAGLFMKRRKKQA